MKVSLKEELIQAINELSQEQQKKVLEWIQSLSKEKIKPPTGRLGLKKPFCRDDLYEDVISHRF